jgi:hypothetical protein
VSFAEVLLQIFLNYPRNKETICNIDGPKCQLHQKKIFLKRGCSLVSSWVTFRLISKQTEVDKWCNTFKSHQQGAAHASPIVFSNSTERSGPKRNHGDGRGATFFSLLWESGEARELDFFNHYWRGMEKKCIGSTTGNWLQNYRKLAAELFIRYYCNHTERERETTSESQYLFRDWRTVVLCTGCVVNSEKGLLKRCYAVWLL